MDTSVCFPKISICLIGPLLAGEYEFKDPKSEDEV